ncbi:Flp family type IVb pilin [Mitsuokella multacida]|uniref:Flp family type IVb pilin n=1 Tax=Mitsuokella multacida TaxID=52226 RepID=UPI003F60C1CD
MVEIINYLRARYMSEKAQGITEYALILAFVAVIAGLVLTSDHSTGLSGALIKAFNSVIDKLGGTQIK